MLGRVDGAGERHHAVAMTDLTLDEVREIGTAAIRRVIGDTFSDAAVTAEQDWLDRDVYIFTLRFSTESEWRAASHLAVRMMTAIIDGLWERGDNHFPHVRLLSDGSWTLVRDAAAE